MPVYERHPRRVRPRARRLPAPPRCDDGDLRRRCSRRRCCWCRSSARSSCRTSTRVRCGSARRCPTRSPSTRRRSSGPQLRDLLLGFPRSPPSPTSSGRPDDGTDPIGFFNDEYFVGLKPYDDPAWSGAIRTKPQLHRTRSSEKLAAFPGIIFNYTQPAEDAVDEAETGLKSSLAVKIFGSDLETLEAKAEAVQTRDQRRAGHHGHHAGARARAAEPRRSSPTARRSRATA